MICQACGVEAATRYVSYYQNIGLLIMRLSKSIDGNMCRNCVGKYFWEFTLVNLLVGWWGIVSFIINPFFILNNLFYWCRSLGMEGVPVDARRPLLTDEAIEKIEPHTERLFSSLTAPGTDVQVVCAEIAALAGVTPGQVMMYVQGVIAVAREQE